MRAIAWPFDVVRVLALRAGGRAGQRLLRDRDLRVAALAAIGVLLSLSLALGVPAAAFALGPLLLGVPHLLADVRYLVVRPGYDERWPVVALVFAPLVLVWLHPWASVGLLPTLGAVLAARSGPLRKVIALGCFSAVYAVVWRFPVASTYVILHLHNVVAIALYAWLFARTGRNAWLTVLLFALGSGAILLGACDPLLLRPGAWVTFSSGASFNDMAWQLAPIQGAQNARWVLRIAAFFVFAQSVHYVVWLRLIPDDARERPGVRSFASSLRALEADVGKWLLRGAVALSAVFLVFGVIHLDRARLSYLSMASFHGYLEFAVATLVMLEGRGRAAT
jgi:hypothetical protein